MNQIDLTIKNHSTGAISGYDGQSIEAAAQKFLSVVRRESGEWDIEGYEIAVSIEGLTNDEAYDLLWDEAERIDKARVVTVSIKAGETRYGRYGYGIEAIRPDGEIFSLVNSGYSGEWEWLGKYSTMPMWARGAERLTVQEAGFSGDDCQRLPDEGGYWRWAVRLPQGWRVRGGAVSYLDRPITTHAKIDE